MTQLRFLWFALGLGPLLLLLLLATGAMQPEKPTALPLLTMLFIAEFGFLVCLGAAVVALRHWLAQRHMARLLYAGLCCGGLSLAFVALGWRIWESFIAPQVSG